MSAVIRLARLVGDPEWHVFPGATIEGAALALAEHEKDVLEMIDEVEVEVADNEDTSVVWSLKVVRNVVYEVRGLRGGE